MIFTEPGRHCFVPIAHNNVNSQPTNPSCASPEAPSVSASGENITQNGKSVAEQSGIFAGKGGFAVTTGNHTQLDGAVIASTASADKNSLDTGTLGFGNLHNESQTSGNGYTVALSGSAGGSGNGENRNLAPAIGTGQAEESHTGTTSSAVSGGSIVIRNPAGQKQDIVDLSRDTADAHHGVDVNGDVQKVRDNLAVQSEGAALASSALDAYGKYAEQKARESNAALGAKLASEGKLQGDTPQEQEAFLKTLPGYQNTEYGPGSAFWTKGSAAAGLLAGALGGNLKAGAAAGAAPLLASLVKEQKDPTARAALHGIVAAALTQLSGGSSADGLKAGAIGAITASAMTDHLVSALYGDKKSSDLTAEEKRLVSSLVSIAGGLAGAAVTDGSVSMAAMASETAKVEVENNSLSVDQNQHRIKELSECQGNAGCDKGITEKYKQLNAEQHKSVVECKGAKACVDKANEVGGLQTAYANRLGELGDKLHSTGSLATEEKQEWAYLQGVLPQLEADRNAAIHNALMSGDSSEAKQLAINSLAQVAGTSAAGIAAGIGKGGKGSSLPTPTSSDLGLSPANQKYVDILSPEAKQHILYGDSPTQGGHLYPGNPGKTVFPQSWSADKVVHAVGDIATSPDTKWFAQTGTGGAYTNAGRPARWVAWEEREGVRVRVVYEPASGKIVTAFPDNNPTPPGLRPIKK
ncbi:EndoU domain-containing protein [Enterobacter vonholyi]|uniref:EndoU domain-containing protein n=1 Tax=Enterobacter vonholyi TaxID=2797505 RepID=UPI002DBE974C|nr:EndoU domain-containing protein [Enterobacter vonholyi]